MFNLATGERLHYVSGHATTYLGVTQVFTGSVMVGSIDMDKTPDQTPEEEALRYGHQPGGDK